MPGNRAAGLLAPRQKDDTARKLPTVGGLPDKTGNVLRLRFAHYNAAAMAKQTYLDFEQPLAELQTKIDELTELHHGVDQLDVSDEVKKLTQKLADLNKSIYAKLTPWQIAQVARHPQRPYTLDYANGLFTISSSCMVTAPTDDAIVGGLAKV